MYLKIEKSNQCTCPSTYSNTILPSSPTTQQIVMNNQYEMDLKNLEYKIKKAELKKAKIENTKNAFGIITDIVTTSDNLSNLLNKIMNINQNTNNNNIKY